MALKDAVTSAQKNPVMKWVVWIAYALIIVVVVIIISKIIQAVKVGSLAAGDAAGTAVIAAQTGIGADRQAVCKTAAQNCRNACTIDFIFNHVWLCNDNDVVTALNRLVTAQEAALCASYFQQIAGFSLASLLNNSGVFTSKAYINPTIANAIV